MPQTFLGESILSQAEILEENGNITFHIIWNNYELNQSRQKLKWLFELQRIYGVQLPKMPKVFGKFKNNATLIVLIATNI